ncbi:MAG: ABC transporter substrate-binding protein, partial [Thermomicrobiales bacterium]|nr:ABC transporter substrate-binding protein [Thermomicrobiales bacterium]
MTPHVGLCSRRTLLAASAGLSLGLGLRLAVAQDATPATDGEAAWSFVDGMGETLTLPAMPENVVASLALAAALWDYGVRPVGIFGTPLGPDGTREVYAGDIDLDSVVNISETYGELDLEKLIQLDPDLFVNEMWSRPPDVWGLDPDGLAQLTTMTPVVQIRYVEQPVTETLKSLETLAGLLGADLNDPALVADKEAFEQASADLRAAIAAKPGLKVLVMSGTPEESMWISSPRQSADLLYFQELGLDMVEPETTTNMEYWEELSWEQAGKYPVDLFLIDSRQWSATGEQLVEKVPTFAALPAAKAGQFGGWDIEYVPSYKGFTPVLQRLTEVIRNADPDIVP